MTRFAFLGFVLLLLFVLTACPYSAEFPLDAPNQKISAGLLGEWVEKSDSEFPSYFVISKESEQLYKFVQHDYNSSEKEYTKKVYKAHITKLGNVDFLNLQDLSDEKFYFFKLEKESSGQSFKLFEVTDNIDESFKSSAEMKAFFDKHKALSFFYNKDEKSYNKR
jgi:hypothetical protein